MSHMTAEDGKGKGGIQAHSWRPLRWIVLLLGLVAYGAAALWWHRECTVVKVVEPNSDLTTTTTCAPPTSTSAVVLAMLLLVLLLLWPDISEVTVLGVSLKRKVEAAAKEAAEAKDQVAALTQLTQSLQVQTTSVATSAAAAAASASVSQNFILPDIPWSPRASSRVEKSIPELQQELRDLMASGVGLNLDTVREVDEAKEHLEYDALSDDELKMQLIGEWQRFDDLLDIHDIRRPIRDERLPEREARRRQAQRGFIADYRDTISGVRSLRNAVAHGRVVERDDVLKGLQALELMTPLAQAWLLEHETDPE